MTDFAVMVHLRVLPGSKAEADGFCGGYVWILGRYPSELDFREQVARHLDELGYVAVELADILVVVNASELNDELAPLYDHLDLYPLQYRNFQMYRNDDA